MALHAERGIAATTMADIARRADVGIGTVYHHFPTYDDAIRACGARTVEVTRPPTPEVFRRVRAWPARIHVLVTELFAYYDRHPAFWRAWCDRDRSAVLGDLIARRQQHIAAFVSEALAPLRLPADAVHTVVALTGFAVHRQLLDAGLSTDQAAEHVTEVLTAWLRIGIRSRGQRRPTRGDTLTTVQQPAGEPWKEGER